MKNGDSGQFDREAVETLHRIEEHLAVMRNESPFHERLTEECRPEWWKC